MRELAGRDVYMYIYIYCIIIYGRDIYTFYIFNLLTDTTKSRGVEPTNPTYDAHYTVFLRLIA